MQAFWLGIHPAPQHQLFDALSGLVERVFNQQSAPTIPPLFDSYLFSAPKMSLPFEVNNQANPAIAIIGGRLLLEANEWRRSTNAPRGDCKLFEETVFGSRQALERVNGMQSGGWHTQSAIAEHLAVDPAMPLSEAVKISVMDMFYFAPLQYKNIAAGSNHFYLGGVVDLFPLEIAKRLAQRVIFEKKSAIDRCFINPAWRSVLGINGRKRQQTVYQDETVTHWIDTRNLSSALKLNGIDKKINWRTNTISLAPPTSHDQYVRNIEAQVQFGYQAARKGLVF
jgi:hypothetical protein